MSSIRWHFPRVTPTGKGFSDNALCMGGRERAWMSCLIDRLCTAVLLQRLPFDSKTEGKSVIWRMGEKLFCERLNTVWKLGGPALRLM